MVSRIAIVFLLLSAISVIDRASSVTDLFDKASSVGLQQLQQAASGIVRQPLQVATNYDGPSDFLLEEVFRESFSLAASSPIGGSTTALLDPVTPSISEQDVGFWLYTRRNPRNPTLLKSGGGDARVTLNRSNFNGNAPTKIVIHGWTDSGGSPWMHDMRRNYLGVLDCNVVIVDWSAGSFKEYLVAAKVTKQVGDFLARFIELLVVDGKASLRSMHLLGHSLGAHIAGYAGQNLLGKIGRITGMDPARPDFEAPLLSELKDRLDQSDASFVDVIHTCAGTAGFVRAVGHADFYPNGGSFRQPGCPIFSTQYCSHARSHQFMEESIVNPLGFPAIECNGYNEFKSNKCDKSNGERFVYMGEKLDNDTRGIFFLDTNAETPFGRGEL